MRLTLVISSMSCGGAERVMSIIANAFSEKDNWEVSLLTLDDQSSFYPLNDEVAHFPLGLYRKSRGPVSALKNNLNRVLRLRSAIKKSRPDVILSFADRTNILCLLAGMDIAPVVVSERIHPARHHIGRFWSVMRKQIYPSAALVVAQVQDVSDWIYKNLEVDSVIVPNPIVASQIVPRKSKRFYRIIASGRLVEQKGFDRLIEAFGSVSDDYPEWQLSIFGEGPLDGALQTQIDALSLASKVQLCGRTEKMMEELSVSDIFVLSSRFEGFPNALLEAMGTGLACIAFDCPSGPRDMIEDGENGSLVEDGNVAGLTKAMRVLMADEEICQHFGRRAKASIEPFHVESNIRIWEKHLLSVIRE